MTEPRPAPVALMTDGLWARIGAEAMALVPALEPVVLAPGDVVEDAVLARVDVACLSGDAYPGRVRQLMGSALRAPALTWFHTFSAGVDSPVFTDLLRRGVRVTNSSGTSAPSIARTVVLGVLALSRRLPELLAAQAERRWAPGRFDDVVGDRLLVVGWGPIGQEIARLAEALGMEVEVCRRRELGDEGRPVWPLDRLDDALGRADWVVVALPLTPQTRGLFDRGRLAAMRPGARFLNVGRGDLVDEPALVDALTGGHLGGAVLDVFATEPLPADSALWAMPNVIVTPHMSGSSGLTEARGAALFVENLGRFARGEALHNEVAPPAD